MTAPTPTPAIESWPGIGELIIKALLPMVLTPVMLVLVPLLLLGQSGGARTLTVGVCPAHALHAAELPAAAGDATVRLLRGDCESELRALRGDGRDAVVRVDVDGGAGEVLFKASRSPGREALPVARKLALADQASGSEGWPAATAIDSELELAVGMLVIVLPALLLQWLLGASAPHLLAAVRPTALSRQERLQLHGNVLVLSVAAAIGFLVGLVIATAIGNYMNTGAIQVIRELDAAIRPTPSYTSDVEITAAFLTMAASFVLFFGPAMVLLATACRSRVAFSALFQVGGLTLLIAMMVFGYATSVAPIRFAEWLPLVSSAQSLSALVRGQFLWLPLLVALLVNAAAGALFLSASLRLRQAAPAAAEPVPSSSAA